MQQLSPLQFEELTKQMANMPGNLRATYVDPSTADLFESIEEKNGLEPDQIQSVVRVTSRTMLQLLPIKDFVKNLAEYAGLDKEKAQAVAKDINEQIFQPVREELMQVHGISSENGEITLSGNGDVSHGQEVTPEKKEEAPVVPSNSTPPDNLPTHEEPQTPPAPATGKDELLGHLNGDAPAQAPLKEPAEGVTTPPQPTETHKIDGNAEHHRQQLLERLKNAEEKETSSSFSPETAEKRGGGDKSPESKSPGNTDPKGVTAAWNGKTIDLTKIPPRRELKKEETEHKEELNGREIKLKKGSDGYWYEV